MNRVTRALLRGAGAIAVASLSASAQAESLARRPYLQTVTETAATIVWTTDLAANSVVSFGASPQDLAQSKSDATVVTQHEVTLGGLAPDTRYYYSVGSTFGGTLAGADATHYFETAPTLGTKKKLRAWIVGDSGTGDATQADVRDAMLGFVGAYRPHLFLHMGDMAYSSGTTSEFTSRFFAPYAGVLENIVVWPTLGNHEGKSADSGTQTGPYYTAYVLPKAAEGGGLPSGTEAYYAFDHGNVHFIVLDSHDSPRDTGGAMLTWMAADLAATTQDWVIAFWHHPPYTKGSHDSDTEGQLIEMRENALPILEAGGVDLVLGGHSHIYERSFLLDGAYDTPTTAAGHIKSAGDGKPLGDGPYVKKVGQNAHDGAVYVVAGHGGTGVKGEGDHPVMFFSEVANGSCILDVQDNRLSVVNIRDDGAITDRFGIIKGTGLMIAAPDGGEHLQEGQSFDVQWATAGTIADVSLAYSTNDGATWTTIADSVPNTGTYTWTVPGIDTKMALVRVSDAAAASVNDESNAGFEVAASVIVIPLGSTWKYEDQGVDQGTAWRDAGFDDGAWKSGPAQLGYGDGDEATTIFEAPTHFASAYFRAVVTIDAPVAAAALQVLHDDGVAVWINGVEVFAKHVDDGTDHATFASAQSSENEVSVADIAVSPSPFVIGENVVAAIVKQASESSSDVSFDLSLAITKQAPSGAGGAGGEGAGGATATGAGGATATSTGAGATTGGDAGDDGGCGCSAPGMSRTGAGVGAIATALLALAGARRRAKRA